MRIVFDILVAVAIVLCLSAWAGYQSEQDAKAEKEYKAAKRRVEAKAACRADRLLWSKNWKEERNEC